MILEPGDIISIRHYSNSDTFISVVVEVENYLSSHDTISILLRPEFAELNIFEGDPVAIAIQKNSEVYTTSCHITEINPTKSVIKLLVDNEDYIINNRAYERFPVSLYAEVKKRDEKEDNWFLAVVKNISVEGLMICAKGNMEKDQKLDIKLYLGNDEVNLTAMIMWKVNRDTRSDYGLKIVYMEYTHQRIMKNYIEHIMDEQEKLKSNI